TNSFLVSLTNAIRTGGDLLVNLSVADSGSNLVSLQRRFVLPDITPPRLLTVYPTNGAARLGLWDIYRDFTFSEAIANASVTTNLFVLTNNTGTPVGYSLQNFGTVVRLHFGSPLRPGTIYTNMLLPGITDRANNSFADAQGNPLPSGTNLTLATAAIVSVSPTNGTPVQGGDILRVAVTFERELGANYFRFMLNDAQVTTVPVNNHSITNAAADFLIPLNTSNLVVTIQASDNANFTRPYTLDPISLQFMGDRVTNQPPAIQIVRLNPPSGPVALGQTFTIALRASDDFGVTNLTLTASGPISTNANYGAATNVTVAFAVPTNASPSEPIHLVATATDTSGLRTTNATDIAVLSLQYPFAYGTLFYSRGPASQGTIWAVDPSGNVETQVTSGSGPMISPDGRYLLFGRDTTGDRGNNNLYARDLSTGLEQKLVNENGQWIGNYDWLLDGTNLVYDYGCEIYRISSSGGSSSRLLSQNCADNAPAVNRRDGRIVFHNNGGYTDSGLLLIEPSGSNRRKIPNTMNGDIWPSWSLDGEWISFIHSGNVFKIRPDGFDRLQLTFLNKTGDGFNPIAAWTADGSHLIAAGIVNGTNGLWSIAADGSGVTLFRAEPEVNYAFAGRVYAPATNGVLPQLVTTTPVAGSTNRSLWTTNVILTFNRALASASVTTDGVVFSGTEYAVTNHSSRITLRPALPLQPGTVYTVSVNSNLSDLVSQRVAPASASFMTARILNVEPTNGTPVTGGSYVTATVSFDAGLGANYFSFALNSATQAVVAVSPGATQVSAPLLIPLNAQNPVVQIAASSDAAFSAPYLFAPIPLSFNGNSGTNGAPTVQLNLTSPESGQPIAGARFSILLTGNSGFGISNMTLTVSGVVTANYSFTNGGPVALTFDVPASATAGSAINLLAKAVDVLGIASSNATLQLAVASPPPPLPVGTILYSRAGNPNGTVWRVGLDGSLDQLITTGVQPRLSPDRTALLFGRDKANVGQKNIYLRDMITGQEMLLFSHSDYVVFYDWTPDSSRFVFDYSCGLYLMNRD
ncbi:MAG TPA: Ig-like domain-containing protein, partial [Clostridia bacterium]|nr:Ig-like domain-containing protein [Clostridia bacterium]